MSRRTSALLAVGALTAVSVLTVAQADATPRHRPATAHGAVDTSGTTTRAAEPFGSIALIATAGGDFRVAKSITGTTPRKAGQLSLGGARSAATAINPAQGNDGLLCTDGTDVLPVTNLRSAPAAASSIDASGYTGEGGSGTNFYCDGAAVHGKFALVAGDSKGLLQLVRAHGKWRIDQRVQSSGLNEDGQPHLPGWIRFPDSVTTQATFNNVAIAPRPLKDGSYLAVALDPWNHGLVVLRGVGTAKPRVVGSLSDHSLGSEATAYGSGGLAFVPGSRNQALVMTLHGFAVLALGHPDQPRLKVRTTTPSKPSSLTISADGDHVAVAAGSRVYGYRRVQKAVEHGRKFLPETKFRLGKGADQVTDVAYAANDNLVAVHGVDGGTWFLTLVRKVPRGRHAVQGSLKIPEPNQSGSLSVWPAA